MMFVVYFKSLYLCKRHKHLYEIYNQDNGSVYDIFLKIGDLSYLSSDEIQYIKNRATPTLSKEIITGFPLKFSTILEPLEIQLVEIKHIQTILNK